MPENGSRLVVAAGSRAAERLAVERVLELAGEARRDVSLLARPVRVLVPSVSLRDPFEAALLRTAGHALVGVRVQTLVNAAGEIAERAGERTRRPSALAEVLVRRFAAREEALSRPLADLVDGYAAVADAVRDLFDAGFESAHADALDEVLVTEGKGVAAEHQLERARAVVRVAAAVQLAEEAVGLRSHAAFLRGARGVLEAGDPQDVLPSRALLLHGFSTVNGVVGDLLEELLRCFDGEAFVDAEAGGRLVERLSRVAIPLTPTPDRGEGGQQAVHHFRAPDADAELREIARRARRLLDDGTAAERIAVVLPPALALTARRQLRTLGIPFSAVGLQGPPRPARRRLLLLLELLRRGGETRLERWLDSLASAGGAVLDGERRAELRQAFFARGASRLQDFERLDSGGLASDDIRTAVAAAGAALAATLRSWRDGERETYAGWSSRLDRLLVHHLGWPRDPETREGETRVHLEGVLNRLDVPAELRLDHDEMLHLVADALRGEEAEPLGGLGRGVQVLTPDEARGRTFEHLFLCGANRGTLPRPPREDPLLRDRLRAVLARLLPDLGRRADHADDERRLFEQLLSAAPRVTLSWHEEDARGRERAPSSLVSLDHEVERVPPVLSAGLDDAERPVEETLRRHAVRGERSAFAELLPLAFEEVVPATASPAELAAARLAVLNELDPDRSTREGRQRVVQPGPYHGFIGPRSEVERLAVTTLESYAACPWQTFLTRLLGLTPLPDPLAALPALKGLMTGRVVHRTLERIGLDILRGGGWPAADVLDVLLHESATEVLAEDGLALKGLVGAAVEQARPYLEVAERLDFSPAVPPIAAVELVESLTIPGGDGRPREVRFRADRRDDTPGGRRYTDYKTGGRPGPEGKDGPAAQVARGEILQGAAYAYAGSSAVGRYVFLRPDLDESERVLLLRGDDAELRASFERTVRTLLAGWGEGVFFPRVVLPDEDVEPRRCRHCAVAEACLRRDSGTRLRLRRVAADEAGGDAFDGVWRLPSRQS